MPLLEYVSTTTIPARTNPFDAKKFFQTSDGLWVSSTFANLFDLKTVKSTPKRSYVASLLKENAYDTGIREELPATHLSTLEDIAGLIEAQRSCKSGFLLSNCYANIFYVDGKNGEVFAVGVHWDSDDLRWYVGGWRIDEIGLWSADTLVLCPGNADSLKPNTEMRSPSDTLTIAIETVKKSGYKVIKEM